MAKHSLALSNSIITNMEISESQYHLHSHYSVQGKIYGIYMSRGSVVTCLNCAGIMGDCCVADVLLSVPMKEI